MPRREVRADCADRRQHTRRPGRERWGGGLSCRRDSEISTRERTHARNGHKRRNKACRREEEEEPTNRGYTVEPRGKHRTQRPRPPFSLMPDTKIGKLDHPEQYGRRYMLAVYSSSNAQWHLPSTSSTKVSVRTSTAPRTATSSGPPSPTSKCAWHEVLAEEIIGYSRGALPPATRRGPERMRPFLD